ncbi:Uncharacterized conserved protein YndB, AHSA1/START domain [Pseudarcicella hirudinis]|uniref:Uncharacterized conserved protein YndB, AHSA1/START domain n=1 Tax=Pseudarcicella hirudinis TaxID=1079859 RepID=A0A1I5SLJ5_9BACT|nr:SRPBCC family protein [Pseudarcicella hirudinis]SFP71630.1 Uncharacterized conserved protein YndB, AHSA1/START domain [Pseudarcicella hirudinis]
MEQTNNDTADRELRITRLLNAPVDLVWEVWTQPEDIAQWWGPNGFTNTIHTMELRAGGEWRLSMHGPDGKNYPNRSEFLEIAPFQKIVFQHYNPGYLATISFESQEEQTLLNWTMLFDTPEMFHTVVKVFKADEGLQQNVEKLEQYLKQKI